MEDKSIQTQIDGINNKLDIIINEMERQKRARSEMADLRDDLTRVGTDFYHATVRELDEMSVNLDMADVVYLFKKLLRNINTITGAFEQIESLRDFISDFDSISGDMFQSVILKMDDLERKGYFELLLETGNILDKVVSSFSVDDMKRINETIPALARIINRLTNPALIGKLDTIVEAFESYTFDADTKPSVFKLAKAADKPEVKKGVLYTLGLFEFIVKELETKK